MIDQSAQPLAQAVTQPAATVAPRRGKAVEGAIPKPGQPLKYPFLPTWCPGCGNFGILNAIKSAIHKTGLPKEKIVIVFDIGCCGNMADFLDYFGFHSLHGRALPPAAAIKLANHDLKVIVVIGDGGCYGEGGTHFLNLMRGNHDITVLIHNNHRYSLTTGQMSPTTYHGVETKSTPEGSIELPMNPVAIALSNHATFIAREFSGAIPRLSARITDAINHPGFAMIDVLQICPVYNPEMDMKWYRERTVSLEEMGHNSADRGAAWVHAMGGEKLPVGLFFQEQKPTYHQQVTELQKSTLINHDKSVVNMEKLFADHR